MTKNYIYKEIKMNTGYSTSNANEIDDVVIDKDLQAVIIYDQDVIIQDIIIAIRENFLMEELIAERSAANRELVFNKLELLIEEDERVIPGTVEAVMSYNHDINRHQILVSADTYEFGNINLEIKNNE